MKRSRGKAGRGEEEDDGEGIEERESTMALQVNTRSKKSRKSESREVMHKMERGKEKERREGKM